MEGSTTTASMNGRVISPEDVLECLMNDGTIDSMRLKIINQLKTNEELKNTTIKMAERSKVLNAPGAEKQTKRELFESLRQELESSVLEKASKAVWELVLDTNGLGTEICDTVEKVFCRLSGREPPLYPPNVEPQSEKIKEKDSEKGIQIERENNKKESSGSPAKKRKFDDLSSEEGGDEIASGSNKPPVPHPQ